MSRSESGAMNKFRISFGKSRKSTGLCQNDECRVKLELPGDKSEIAMEPGRSVYLQLCVLCVDRLRVAADTGETVQIVER